MVNYYTKIWDLKVSVIIGQRKENIYKNKISVSLLQQSLILFVSRSRQDPTTVITRKSW